MTDDELMERLWAERYVVLGRLQKNHFERYELLRGRIDGHDLTTDDYFQKTFNGLYKVRRNADWRSIYYAVMERTKRKMALSFENVLRELHSSTGRVEFSFASKLVAIIDPNRSVYDSVVGGHLSVRPPHYGSSPEVRISQCVARYTQLGIRVLGLTHHRLFKPLSDALGEAFPGYDTTPVRQMDILLWRLPSQDA